MSRHSIAIRFLSAAILLAGLFSFSSRSAQALEECRGAGILSSRICAGDGIEAEEARLAQGVNEFRARNKLPGVPLSASLTLVANRHARDLAENVGFLTHGWSDCPYDPQDPGTWHCMWQAPRRLRTAYPGKGYENAHFLSSGRATAASALEAWKKSSPHREVILSQGKWKTYPWKALGVGIDKGFAVIWFGVEPDPSGPPP